MVCSTSFRVVLYNHVAHLRCINLLKLPPRRILFEILAVGTSVVLVEEGRCGVDAWFELLARKCHIDAPYQRSIPCKQKIHVWRTSLLRKL